MTERSPLADMIRTARLAKGLTQVQAAQALGFARTTLAALETGQSNPQYAPTLDRIAEVLEIDRADLDLAAGNIPPDIIAWLKETPDHARQVRALMEQEGS